MFKRLIHLAAVFFVAAFFSVAEANAQFTTVTLPDGAQWPYMMFSSKDGKQAASNDYDSTGNYYPGFRYSDGSVFTLGNPVGGTDFSVVGISADGAVIAGYGSDGSGVSHAFWHKDGAVQDLGSFGYGSIYVSDISLDGSTIVGYVYDSGCGCYNAYKYDGTFTALTSVGGSDAYANGVSADGSVIVGTLVESGYEKAFKLDNGTLTNIGNVIGATTSRAYAVSADGSAVIGTSSSGIFLYKDSTLTNLATLGASSLGGSSYVFYNNSVSYKNSLSADGSVVIGDYTLSGHTRAFKYQGGSVVDLGTLGGNTTYATGVSADGSIVVGLSANVSGDNHLFKYVSGTMYDLGKVGTSSNFSVSAISADGSTIFGYADDSNMYVFKTGLTADTSSIDAYLSSSSSSSSTSSINLTHTYSELGYNQNQLNSIINLRTSLLRSTLNQECTKFGANGFCVGASYRYSSVSRNHANQNFANVLQFAYQPTERLKFGMIIDQAFSENDPNNFTAQNSQPLVSLYSKFTQNVDGTGAGLKLAAARSKSKLWIRRSNELSGTEQGAGSSVVQSKAFLVEASYLQNFGENFALKPYTSWRKTSVQRNAYTEVQNAAFPISFNVAAQKLTTVTLGLDSTLKLTKSVSASLGFGMEHNIRRSADGYSGNINSVGNFAFDSPSLREKTAFVNAGVAYDLDAAQRVAFDTYYGGQALNKGNAATVYLSYYLGF